MTPTVCESEIIVQSERVAVAVKFRLWAIAGATDRILDVTKKPKKTKF